MEEPLASVGLLLTPEFASRPIWAVNGRTKVLLEALPAVLEAALLGGNEPLVPCVRICGVTIAPSFELRLFGT